MKLITKPLLAPPHTCVITGREDGEIVDFEAVPDCIQPPNIYIKREVVEQAGELCGMRKEADFTALEEENARLVAELEELRKQMQDESIRMLGELDAGRERAIANA